MRGKIICLTAAAFLGLPISAASAWPMPPTLTVSVGDVSGAGRALDFTVSGRFDPGTWSACTDEVQVVVFRLNKTVEGTWAGTYPAEDTPIVTVSDSGEFYAAFQDAKPGRYSATTLSTSLACYATAPGFVKVRPTN